MRKLLIILFAIAFCAVSCEIQKAYAFGDEGISRSIENETDLDRREATRAEIAQAIKNGKSIYAEMTPEKKAEIKKKHIRYIAVRTVPRSNPITESTSGGTPDPSKADVMIYDLYGVTTINKYVYTVPAPTVFSKVKLDGNDILYAAN